MISSVMLQRLCKFRLVSMSSLYTAGESLPGYGRLYKYSVKEKIYAAKLL